MLLRFKFDTSTTWWKSNLEIAVVMKQTLGNYNAPSPSPTKLREMGKILKSLVRLLVVSVCCPDDIF